jgi:hypothetical protein
LRVLSISAGVVPTTATASRENSAPPSATTLDNANPYGNVVEGKEKEGKLKEKSTTEQQHENGGGKKSWVCLDLNWIDPRMLIMN